MKYNGITCKIKGLERYKLSLESVANNRFFWTDHDLYLDEMLFQI